MKRVLITGISRGIGLATARKFLDEGWQVIGAVKEAGPLKNNCLQTIDLDLSDAQSIAAAAERLKREADFDVLINNAAVFLDDDEEAVKIDKLRATLEVNLIGLIDFTERVLPFIKKGGHIINISSSAGQLGEPLEHLKHPAYKISKCALNMYTKVLAKRLENQIIVSSLHPGHVRTEMGGPGAPDAPEEAAADIFNLANRSIPSGRFWHRGKEISW